MQIFTSTFDRLRFFSCSLLLLGFTQLLSAQDLAECKAIVDLTVASINSSSSDQLTPYLADDFTIAGQQGSIAKLVLDQLFSQLKDSVLSYQEIEQSNSDQGLTLVYNVNYKNLGPKQSKFWFNKQNLLTELSLFDMEVKTLDKEAEVVKSTQDFIEIPFTMASKLIKVNVKVNGVDRPFIFDSGAAKVILNAAHVNDNGEALNSISSVQGVSGNISGMDIIKVEQLDFHGIQLNNQEVISADLSHLEESLETEFYGLIGYDIIKDYDILYDYKNQTITLIDPDKYEAFKSEQLAKMSSLAVPFTLESHIPVVEVQIANTSYALGIDCGAESNLMSEPLHAKLKKHSKKLKSDKLLGAENQSKVVKKAKVKRMDIGVKSFHSLTTVFSDISHLNKGYNINIDGLIGYEILHKQITLISYKRKELVFFE